MATLCTRDRRLGTIRQDERLRVWATDGYIIQSDKRMWDAIAEAEKPTTLPEPLPQLWSKWQPFESELEPDGFDYSFCRERRAHYHDSTQEIFLVVCNFRPFANGEAPGFENREPHLRPLMVWAESETYADRVDSDRDGKKIVNPAQEPYPDPIEREASKTLVCCRWNVLTFQQTVDLQQKYEGHVNEKDFYITPGDNPQDPILIPKNKGLCRWMRSQPVERENQRVFYPMVAKFSLERGDREWERPMEAEGYQHWKWKESSGPVDPENPVDTDYEMEDDPSHPGRQRRKLFSTGGVIKLLSKDGVLLDEGEDPHIDKWGIEPLADFTGNDLPFGGAPP